MVNLFRAIGFLYGTCCLFWGGYVCYGIGFQGHSNSIECIACSPDGRYVASGSRDGTIRIWEIESGRLKKVLKGHEFVNTVSWSPDGKWLLSSGAYDKVILWDFITGKEKWFFCGKIKSVQWSPDGTFILLTQKEKHGASLKIFSVEALDKMPMDGLVQNILFEEEHVIASWSFDGRFVAAMLDKKKVVFFDTQQEYFRFGSIPSIATDEKNGFCQMKWSPTSPLLAVGDCCGNILIWDTERDVLKTTLQGQFASMCLQWSPDGWNIASQGIHPDRSFWVWNVETGQKLDYQQDSTNDDDIFTTDGFIRGKKYGKLGEIVQQKRFIRYRLSEFCNVLVWSPDGKYLISGDADYILRIYRATDGKLLYELGNAFYRLEFKWGRFWGFNC